MIISSPEKWAIIDLTLNPEKDPESVSKYSHLPKNILADIGMKVPRADIKSVIVFGSDNSVNEEKCRGFKSAGVVIGPDGEGNKFYDNKDYLQDDKLRVEFNGIPDSLPPAPTSILAVPETTGKRLRKAIVPVLFLYIESGEKRTFHASEIVTELLGGDERIFSLHSRQKMEGGIRNLLMDAMQELNKKLKKRFITYNQKTEEFTIYTKGLSRTRLHDAITEWSNPAKEAVSTTLDQF